MQSSNNWVKLFVYGTLKSGFTAEYLMHPGKVIEAEKVLYGYKMYTNGGYPMVVPGDKANKVIGEVWEIPKENLYDLDSYEGHPSLFKRTKILDDIFIYLYNHSDYLNSHYTTFLESGIFK